MPRSTKGEAVEDAVRRQEQAYNAHDVEAFVACYAEDVVVEDADGNIVMNGRDDMRERYRRLFAESPDVRAEVVTRIRVGAWVVDEEWVIGRAGGDIHAVAVYRLDSAGSIDHVRLLL
jgi:uncharacterized protein (TIGR02246 family)